MYVIYRKNGALIEITEIEKTPSSHKVRVHPSRKRPDIYGPKRPDNLRRTRQICMRRLSGALEEFGCPLLVALTFSGDASDAAFASDSLRIFQVRLRAKFAGAESVFVPELSPKGRIHFHGLLFNVPLRLGDTRQGRRIISHGDERSERVLAKLWGEGFVDATKTDGSRRLASYISKYITKGAGQVMFNAIKLLRISQGFPKEILIKGEFAGYLAHRYAERKPDQEWTRDNIFLGQITKKTYYQDNP